jgi:hypothetical protein
VEIGAFVGGLVVIGVRDGAFVGGRVGALVGGFTGTFATGVKTQTLVATVHVSTVLGLLSLHSVLL